MMKSRTVLVTLLLSPAFAVAADFWVQKPYGEWTEKEVQKLMSDSPWARPARITLTTQDAGGGGGAGDDDGGPDEGNGKLTLHVIWIGKTMRMAQVRKGILSGGAADEARDKATIDGGSPDSYVVILQAIGFAPITKISEADLQAATKLVVGKKGGREVSPSKVTKPPEARGSVVVFTFPREPAITAADGTVAFESKVGKYPISVKFDLADMTSGSDLDL